MKGQGAIREEGTGIALVRRPVRRVEATGQVLRDGTTGRVVSFVPRVVDRPKVVLLPKVWAVAEAEVKAETHLSEGGCGAPVPVHGERADPKEEMAFYRKYTEAMLRRYVRLSMAAGRVPSLLGRELFRGNVTSYRMTNFEDVVVFCFDMERLLGRMRTMDQQLIKRIAMQQYPQGEVASMLRISLRTCMQTYGQAIDRLTEMLLEARMLEPLQG